MIFITLGSQKFQFNRLLKKVDELIEKKLINEKVYAQIGYSDYKPVHFEYVEFMDRERFSLKMEEAEIVITHGGTGAIVTAVKKKKKVIAVPRRVEFGEHVDNHQLQIVEQFKELGFIYDCIDCDTLIDSITYVKNNSFSEYVSNSDRIRNSIIDFIDNI